MNQSTSNLEKYFYQTNGRIEWDSKNKVYIDV